MCIAYIIIEAKASKEYAWKSKMKAAVEDEGLKMVVV
jgi:hypothetical protein